MGEDANFGVYPFQRLSGNSEQAPIRSSLSLQNGAKWHLFDASAYQRTRHSTRTATFQTVSGETVWKLRFCSNWGFTRPRNEDERSQFGTLQLAKDVLSDTSSDFPDSLSMH